ncbi:MAG: septum formation initiator family protein [Burkholderiales bacterium]|nr:septum formation initiator family protein [Burkholderiales bacterium]
MQKILFLCLIGVIVIFLYQLKHGNGGYADDVKLVKKIGIQTQLNESLYNRNSMLKMKIEGLKGSIDSLEARARYELNLVKPRETLVVLPGNYSIKVPPAKATNNKS